MTDPELRRLGIGGSEIAAILGCDERRDAYSVWAEKKFVYPPAQPTPRMRLGRALEQGIVVYYSEITGWPTEWCDITRRHPQRPYMVFTADALVKGKRKGVDAKVVFWDQRHRWGPTADDIPERVQLQCWWYMAALDYDTWDVAALVGEDVPRIYTIGRDPEAERVMLARAEEFYYRYIAGDEEPPVGGSGATTEWLKRQFPRNRADIRGATEEETGWLEAYADVRNSIAALKPQKTLLENQLRRAVGERDGLVWDAGKFTWKKTKDTLETDWEGLARALIGSSRFTEDEAVALIKQFTHEKPGVRRIWFGCDRLAGESAEAA